MKPTPDFLNLLNQFNNSLKDCRDVYLDGAQNVIDHYPHLLDRTAEKFLAMMDDLHRGLLVKLFVVIGGADRTWTALEQQLAEVLFFHLWQRQLGRTELDATIEHIEQQSAEMSWHSLVRPFAVIQPLRESIPELETSLIRIGNLIAKADGQPTSLELANLKSVQREILAYLHDRQRKQGDSNQQDESPGRYQIEIDPGTAGPAAVAADVDSKISVPAKPDLQQALAHLDELVGLDHIKQQVRTLINFLKIQRQRKLMDLPVADVGLHMVFRGNPGTGKTTVARILGEIYQAIGLLKKGHLVETDRSGLVAEYAGQTAPKTDKMIDQAIDGVLFIDEAYSLVSSQRDDPFGNEAVQKLLKRMEDDRERLIVILAGYPDKMDRLLNSNPGFSSRFTHHIDFQDYSPLELARIFELMCNKNLYRIKGLARAKLLLGFQMVHSSRDKYFGNGRLARNIFELAIRRLANRIVDLPKLTKNLLVQFEPSDIHFEDLLLKALSHEVLANSRFDCGCPNCQVELNLNADLLGRRIQCKKCNHKFRIHWSEINPG